MAKIKEVEVETKTKNSKIIFNPIIETRESVSTSLKLMASALTLVAGLAWNDAIKQFTSDVIQPVINSLFNNTLGNVAAIITPFIYAIIITVLVVFMVSRIEKVEERFRKKEEKEVEEALK
jgi:predicted PurR-regulated permease PerM